MTVEHITVLRAQKPKRLAKVWRVNGEITHYDDAKNYTVDPQPAGDIRSLGALLAGLQHDPHAAIIRGGYLGDAIAGPILEKEQDKYWERGFAMRRKVVFKDRRSRMLMLDIDRFKPALADPKADPEGCIDEFVRATLPACFWGASCYWQLSNSAGHKTVEGLFNAHIWFWLSTPHTSAELRRWAASEAQAVDRSVFDEIQLHYTANPLFDPGMVDPVGIRSGFIEGYMGDSVPLVIAASVVRDDTITAGLRSTASDPIAELLHNKGMVRGDGNHGALDIVCPRQAEHSGAKTNPGACFYFPAHTRGFARGNFKCLHGHCAGVTHEAFLLALGIEPAGDGGRIDMTDAGNVNALYEITDGDMSFIFGPDNWMHWDSVRWRQDPTLSTATKQALRVAERYKNIAIEKAAEAETTTDADSKNDLEDMAKAAESWAKYCRSKRGIDAMLGLAARDPRFVIQVDALDQDRCLLGVDNGVVDLRTGQLRETARRDLVTKASPFRFDPLASMERTQAFIRDICSIAVDDGRSVGPMVYRSRPEQESYLQKMLGYCLTGLIKEQKMWVFSGGGANGKSVLVDMVAAVLGNYCVYMPPEAIMASTKQSDGEGPTPFARTLAGARLAISSEAREGQKLNAALIKRQTGDAKLTARGCRENAYTFTTTHKLVLQTNHHPELDYADDAIRSRLHIVPFDRTWNRGGALVQNPRLADGDKNLLEKLQAEAAGFLRWLVEGARQYLAEGLSTPPAVTSTTAAYLRVQDPMTVWLEETTPCAASAGTPAAALFDAYQKFCAQQGMERPHPNNPTSFGIALAARNVQSTRTGAGKRYGLLYSPSADLF